MSTDSKEDTTKKTFNIDQLDAADEGHMTILANGELTDWVWVFCGPGDARAIAQSQRVSREQLHKNRMKEQMLANGKKWKAPEQTPDELLIDNVNFVLERLTSWYMRDGSPVMFGNDNYPFSQENARKLLMDRKKASLLQQSIEYILADDSFTDRSAKS